VDGRRLSYKQLEGGFTQPNAGVSVKMSEWARSAAVSDVEPASGGGAGGGVSGGDVRRDDDFLELYCGNANFTIAMAPMFRKAGVLRHHTSKISHTLPNNPRNRTS